MAQIANIVVGTPRNIQNISITTGTKTSGGIVPGDVDSKNEPISRAATPGSFASLYSPGKSQQVPVLLFSSPGNPVLKIEVSEIPSSFEGRQCLLKVNAEGSTNASLGDSKPSVVSNSQAIFDWGSYLYERGVPTGFRGLLSFTLSLQDESSEAPSGGLSVGSAPVELYTMPLTKQQLPGFFQDTIPLELLRIFLLPIAPVTDSGFENAAGPMRGQADWVSLVARICHGTAAPETGKDADTVNHWLKYETFDGNPGFGVGANGQAFHLDAWLVAYKVFKSQGVYSPVNCYDQAAIVQVALSLGLQAEQIVWEYHQVYGFIPKTSKLVGWGPCNNPYFEDDRKNQIVPEKDPIRWPFRNHAYISWRSLDAWDKPRLVIDACAGPALGTQDNDDYNKGKDSIYRDNVLNGVSSGDSDGKRWTEVHQTGKGIQELTFPDKGSVPGYVHPHQDTTYPYNDTRAKIGGPEWTYNEGLFKGDVHNLLERYSEFVKSIHGSNDEYPIAPDMWKYVPVLPIYSARGVQVELKLYAENDIKHSFGSLRIFVAKDEGTAIDLLSQRAALFNNNSNSHFKISDITIPGSSRPTKVVGSNNVHLFAYRNLFMQVSGLNYNFREPQRNPDGTLVKDKEGVVYHVKNGKNAWVYMLSKISQEVSVRVREEADRDAQASTDRETILQTLKRVPGFEPDWVLFGDE